MHFHFPFTAVDVLWTLTFAAHLVLLVVLLGRDRAGRFPIFTTSIALVAFRLLTSKLLMGRLPQMTMLEMVIITAVISVVVGLLLLIELSRKALGRAPRAAWLTGALIVMAIGAAVVWKWGVWPAWEQVKHGSPFQLLQLFAQKGNLLLDVENVLVGLLIVLFGSRWGAGWRSHTQRIVIGLSTASSAQLAIQAIWEAIAKHAAPKSMDEYNHIIAFREKLFNANSVIFVAVLVWWIVTLWFDEPGTARAATPEETAAVIEGQPALLETPATEVPDSDLTQAPETRPLNPEP
jgi:hypothetical protein